MSRKPLSYTKFAITTFNAHYFSSGRSDHHFVVLDEKDNQRKRAGSRAMFEFSWFGLS